MSGFLVVVGLFVLAFCVTVYTLGILYPDLPTKARREVVTNLIVVVGAIWWAWQIGGARMFFGEVAP